MCIAIVNGGTITCVTSMSSAMCLVAHLSRRLGSKCSHLFSSILVTYLLNQGISVRVLTSAREVVTLLLPSGLFNNSPCSYWIPNSTYQCPHELKPPVEPILSSLVV